MFLGLALFTLPSHAQDLPIPANDLAKQGAGFKPLPSKPGFDGKPLDPNKLIRVTVDSPKPDAVVAGPQVDVFVRVENYQLTPGGNRLNVILDNRRSEWVYNTAAPISFKDVAPGAHTLRVVAVKGNGEAIKSFGAYLRTHFYVGQADPSQLIPPSEPVLTVTSPRGTYSGEQADIIVFDYMIENAKLENNGTRLMYLLNGRKSFTAEKGPIQLAGLPQGKHTLIAEVVDATGKPIPGRINRVETNFSVERGRVAPPPGQDTTPDLEIDESAHEVPAAPAAPATP